MMSREDGCLASFDILLDAFLATYRNTIYTGARLLFCI